MMAAPMERIGQVVCAVGESPLWCTRRGLWFWVDITARAIWRFDPGSGEVREYRAPQMVACLALDGDGDLIAGMEDGVYSVQLDDSSCLAHARQLTAPLASMAGMRFNDGRCDRQGRFWSGTMALDAALAPGCGKLYRYGAADGLSEPVVENLVVQNGLAWSPDGRTMYLSDSHTSRQLVWAFDYDSGSGMPSRRRVFIDMNDHPGRPDGAAIDVDGCYWTCANDAGMIHRFTPAGRLDRSIAVPMAKPSMCSFGGADMRTLLVTSISTGAPAGDALAGAVFLLEPGIEGMPEQRFGGK